MADLQSMVQMAYQDVFDGEATFDAVTSAMVEDLAATHSIPVGYVLPPLLTAAAHLCNKSKIRPWKSYAEPCCLYAMTCGFTSTNKSCALSIVSDALREAEVAKKLELNKSRLNQCRSTSGHSNCIMILVDDIVIYLYYNRLIP